MCDLADGASFDCNVNGIPDECEPDCNTNGIPDECDINDGTSDDADGNGIPDECEVVNGFLIITGVFDAQLTTGAGPKGAELYVVSDIADLSFMVLVAQTMVVAVMAKNLHSQLDLLLLVRTFM